MSTPMFELPDHLYLPIDEKGEGPASPEEAVEEVCWCGDRECEVFPVREYRGVAK